MKPIRFSNRSGLQVLMEAFQPLVEQWKINWVSTNSEHLALEADLLLSPPTQKSWFSVSANKGHLFVPHDEQTLVSLVELIFGVDDKAARVLLEKNITKTLVFHAIEELLLSFSAHLGGNSKQHLVETNKPSLQFGLINAGGYVFTLGPIEIVADGALTKVENPSSSQLSSLSSSIEKSKVTTEIYLPTSKVKYDQIVNLQKGNLLITDAKVGNALELRVNNKAFKAGFLAKREKNLVLQINNEDR
ncbi:FliM/FliN family flagellar motor switch protein [Agarivorans sp. DSG3-1]|uniref:FliM/FliN family flagellar motor switch protein n=1 Tax=Agarivorans sp. DSG3-1 TaxID=3342249 RepID=UPI00398EC77E